MTDVLIIGGSDAGISAALRAKELEPTVNVTVVVADSFPNYSICGLQFYLSGEVSDWHYRLIERWRRLHTKAFIACSTIRLRPSIQPKKA